MPLDVGIDFGSLGCRAAFREGDHVVTLEAEPPEGKSDAWLRYKPASSTSLGFAFPSVKTLLGQSTVASTPDTAQITESVVGLLAKLKAAIEARTKNTVGRTVITVPARCPMSRRSALRDASQRAGFGETFLLNDSMAAAIARAHASSKPATLLIYCMGYSGFEVALIRVARGRFRALGYEGADAPAGATLDELFLRTWLTGFAERNMAPDTRTWDPTRWLGLRRRAQETKESLSTAPDAIFPIGLTARGTAQTWYLTFKRKALADEIGRAIPPTLQMAERLLAAAGFGKADVDELLLVGGTTRIASLGEVTAQWFGRPVQALDADTLAHGAALHASQLDGGSPAPDAPQAPEAEPVDPTNAPANESTLRADLVANDSATATNTAESIPHIRKEPGVDGTSEPTPEALLSFPKALAGQQQSDRATKFLEELIRQSQTLLRNIRAQPTPRTSPPRARRALEQAARLLKLGRLVDAVTQSHLAWQAAPDSPDIFDQMLAIHRQAAQAAMGLDAYDDARRWLICAHSHDQGDVGIRHALAEQNLAQARKLVERGRRSEARTILQECLTWNPDLKEAETLLRTLTRK